MELLRERCLRCGSTSDCYCPNGPIHSIVLSEAELEELYRFTEHSYISVTEFPALLQLLNRIARYRQIREQQSA